MVKDLPFLFGVIVEGLESFPFSDGGAGGNVWVLRWFGCGRGIDVACPGSEDCGRKEFAEEAFSIAPRNFDSSEVGTDSGVGWLSYDFCEGLVWHERQDILTRHFDE
jgi:hypothetical protein